MLKKLLNINPGNLFAKIFIFIIIIITIWAFIAQVTQKEVKATTQEDPTLAILAQEFSTRLLLDQNADQKLKTATSEKKETLRDLCFAWKAYKARKQLNKLPIDNQANYCNGVEETQTVSFIPTAKAQVLTFEESQEVEQIQKIQEKQFYQKKKVGEDQNQYVKLASQISGNNLDFITTLEQENGLWKPDRLSPKNSNGTRDSGFCQMNSAVHGAFIKSPDFKDPQKQLQKCWEIFQARPTAFYGYYLRKKHTDKFYLAS